MASIKLRNVNPVVFNHNIGLGDPNPTEKLVINTGSIRIDGNNVGEGILFKSLSNSGNKSSLLWQNSNGTEKFRLVFDESGNKTNDLRITSNGNATNCLTILQNGNVGLGGSTSPDSALHVLGDSIRINNGTDNAAGRLFLSEGNYDDKYGFSLMYAGSANPTLDGTAFVAFANTFNIVRHDNNAVGTKVVSIDRETGAVDFVEGTLMFASDTNRTLIASNTELRIGSTFNNLKFSGTGGAYITSDASNGTTPFKITSNVSHSSGDLVQIYNANDLKFKFSADGNFEAAVFSDTGSSAGFQLYSGGSVIRTSAASSLTAVHYFLYNTNGQVGSISTSGSGTTYATSSDYRLKENVKEITDSVDRIKLLSPVKFNFKTDKTKTVDGFLAHEVANVVPEAVVGEKDAVSEDGKIVPQGIDEAKLVPLLTAAAQELIERVEKLEKNLQ